MEINNKSKCVVLFSGGTDSTASAYLAAEKFENIYLLTFKELATKSSPVPIENLQKLRVAFPNRTFIQKVIFIDETLKKISYDKYLKNIFGYGFYNLATPGFSSLSWHLHTIKFCLDHEIRQVFDGMTRELMHLPGHMPCVRKLFEILYHRSSIEFSSPVYDWDVPTEQRFTDRLIIDNHGFVSRPELKDSKRTTGYWLYQKGILPHPNVKGSLFDQRMQHDCYPFVVFNMFVFWWAEIVYGLKKYEQVIEQLMSDKMSLGQSMLDNGQISNEKI